MVLWFLICLWLYLYQRAGLILQLCVGREQSAEPADTHLCWMMNTSPVCLEPH